MCFSLSVRAVCHWCLAAVTCLGVIVHAWHGSQVAMEGSWSMQMQMPVLLCEREGEEWKGLMVGSRANLVISPRKVLLMRDQEARDSGVGDRH